MKKDFIEIDGRRYRVECNWDAIVTFCELKGLKTLEALDKIQNIELRDVSPLIYACVQQGEAMENREFNVEFDEFRKLLKPTHIKGFMPIFVSQFSQPDMGQKTEPEQKKSKLTRLLGR